MKEHDEDFVLSFRELDTLLIRIPRRIENACLDLAEAKDDYERAKSRLEVCEAELDKAIRTSPALFGLDDAKKPTEAQIERTMVLEKPHAKARAEELEAKHRMDVLQARVNRAYADKQSLELMVKLELARWNQEVRLPSEDAGAMHERSMRSTFDQRKKERIK